MILGMMVIIIAGLWMAVRPCLSPQLVTAERAEAGSEVQKTLVSRNSLLDTRQGTMLHENPASSSKNRASNSKNREPQTINGASHAVQSQKIHIVHQGDTLSAIAGQYYGSANQWQKIFDANRSRIKDANRLTPGTQLIIPN